MSYIEQKEGSRDLRPVKLAQLDQTELDIACLVVKKSLASDRYAFGDVIERSELQFGKIDTHRGLEIGYFYRVLHSELEKWKF